MKNGEAIKSVRDILEMQGRDGVWDYNPYSLGVYNGIEAGLSFLEGREPKYRRNPEKWLSKNEEQKQKGQNMETATAFPLPLPSAGRLTVQLEIIAINDKGATTFKNTLLLGEMKVSDTIMFELAVAEAIKKIGEADLEKTVATESHGK